MEQFTRITHNIDVMGGKACIRGTRVTVGMILILISEGFNMSELLDSYPYLTRDDIVDALRYAAWNVEARESAINVA